MFLLPWGTGSRNEKVATRKANRAVDAKSPFSMTHVSLLDKTKRKRGDSGSQTPPCSDHVARKKIKEHMSHVELPPYEGNGLVTSSHGQQGNGYIWIDESPVMPADTGGTMDCEGAPQSKLPDDDNNDTSPHEKCLHQKHAVGHTDHTRVLPDTASLETLRQTIESQFSLEILLKHRELRLIDQELAKSQVALEQLRRCQIIPYPAMTSDLEDMQAVSSGAGLMLETRVPHPPPWGVTDGPYTRHYAKWLIPDSAFDVNATEAPRPSQAAGMAVPERSTRGSVSEKSTFTTTSRSQRGSNNARLQALPHGYPEPKEDKGPMILKRSTDGQMVKLVCLDCRRDNFNSAQGFINHCRIAHNRGYTSHDAAALACGEVVEASHTGSVVGESNGTNGASAALVHPLITAAQVTRPTPAVQQPSTSRRKKSMSNTPATNPFSGRLPTTPDCISTPKPDRHASGQTDSILSSFTPSSQTPHLSALLARRGCGGDLDEMVNDAKQKPASGADALSDDDYDDQDQDQDMEDASDLAGDTSSHGVLGILRGGRLPARAARSPAPLDRSASNKGVHGARKPEYLPHIISRPMYSSPYSATASDSTSAHHLHTESTLADTSPSLILSPNAIESHPAPSLVSDDGDYENTHSESESPSSADDHEDQDGYLEIEVEDHDDEINALGESTSATTDHIGLAGSGKPHSPAARRSSALRSPTAIRPGPSNERHVSFASPRRRPREEGPKGSRRRAGR